MESSNLPTKASTSSDVMRQFAEHYDLPIMGVTNMGGKPYVNSAGLMHKAKNIGLKSVKINVEKEATIEEPSAKVKAIVTLKDGSEYEDYGYGSKLSIKMTTLHNPDFLTMTTITRAKNRALRSATGFGMVSAEEMTSADQMYTNENASSPDAPTQTNLDSIKAPEIEAPKEEEKDEKQMDKHIENIKEKTGIEVQKVKIKPKKKEEPKEEKKSDEDIENKLIEEVRKITSILVLKSKYDAVNHACKGDIPEGLETAFKEKEVELNENGEDKSSDNPMDSFYNDKK